MTFKGQSRSDSRSWEITQLETTYQFLIAFHKPIMHCFQATESYWPKSHIFNAISDDNLGRIFETLFSCEKTRQNK